MDISQGQINNINKVNTFSPKTVIIYLPSDIFVFCFHICQTANLIQTIKLRVAVNRDWIHETMNIHIKQEHIIIRIIQRIQFIVY